MRIVRHPVLGLISSMALPGASAASLSQQVGVFGMLADIGADERTFGDDLEALRPYGVERTLDQL
jgi:hypothetical protein